MGSHFSFLFVYNFFLRTYEHITTVECHTEQTYHWWCALVLEIIWWLILIHESVTFGCHDSHELHIIMSGIKGSCNTCSMRVLGVVNSPIMIVSCIRSLSSVICILNLVPYPQWRLASMDHQHTVSRSGCMFCQSAFSPTLDAIFPHASVYLLLACLCLQYGFFFLWQKNQNEPVRLTIWSSRSL